MPKPLSPLYRQKREDVAGTVGEDRLAELTEHRGPAAAVDDRDRGAEGRRKAPLSPGMLSSSGGSVDKRATQEIGPVLGVPPRASRHRSGRSIQLSDARRKATVSDQLSPASCAGPAPRRLRSAPRSLAALPPFPVRPAASDALRAGGFPDIIEPRRSSGSSVVCTIHGIGRAALAELSPLWPIYNRTDDAGRRLAGPLF